MADNSLAAIVLAAGKGTRMGGPLPKVLHEVCGRSMLQWVLDAVLDLKPSPTIVVVGHGREEVERSLAGKFPVEFAEQDEPLGTAHAVAAAQSRLKGFDGKVLVLYGDTPALRTESLRDLVSACPKGGVSFLVAEIDDPASYGRIVRDAAGRFVGIKEERDASASERAIREVNLGAYAFDGPRLFTELAGILAAPRKNEKSEYYLTDVVGRFEKADVEVAIRRTTDPDAWLGINSPRDLARVRRVLQDRILARHLSRGVKIVDPATTYVDWDVDIGEGTVLYPCTVVGRGARIGPNCEVGPFAHLRADAILREGVIVGNYVEVKKAVLGAGAKARHLTYLGDAEVGAGANVGAGTITANWDGRTKHKTTIEEGAFVGSGTVFVAPATLGKGARTGAGAIVTRGTRVPDGETWVGVPARPLPQKGTKGGNSSKEGARPGAGDPSRSGALAPGKGDDGVRG